MWTPTPNLVTAVLDKVSEINRDTGVAVLVVEQKGRDVLRIANRAYGLRLGKVVLEGNSDEVAKPENVRRLFLR